MPTMNLWASERPTRSTTIVALRLKGCLAMLLVLCVAVVAAAVVAAGAVSLAFVLVVVAVVAVVAAVGRSVAYLLVLS